MTDGLYVSTDQFTPCDLHFPHKEWTDNWMERENYAAIERWALHFRKDCLPKGGPVIPPEPPPIIYDYLIDAVPIGQGLHNGDVIAWPSDPTLTTWSGGGVFAYAGSLGWSAFHLPAGTYNIIRLSVTLVDGTPNGIDPWPPGTSITVSLRIRATLTGTPFTELMAFQQDFPPFTVPPVSGTFSASIPVPWVMTSAWRLAPTLLLTAPGGFPAVRVADPVPPLTLVVRGLS